MFGADLGEGVFGDDDVIVGFEAQGAAVGVAALQDKLPSARGEEQRAFLLNHGDALGANSWSERVRGETVEKDAARERLQGASDELQESGFAAGVGAQDG